LQKRRHPKTVTDRRIGMRQGLRAAEALRFVSNLRSESHTVSEST
jgi:hypothetical protein